MTIIQRLFDSNARWVHLLFALLAALLQGPWRLRHDINALAPQPTSRTQNIEDIPFLLCGWTIPRRRTGCVCVIKECLFFASPLECRTRASLCPPSPPPQPRLNHARDASSHLVSYPRTPHTHDTSQSTRVWPIRDAGLDHLTHVPPSLHTQSQVPQLGPLSVVSVSDSRRVLPSTDPQLARRQRVCVCADKQQQQSVASNKQR